MQLKRFTKNLDDLLRPEFAVPAIYLVFLLFAFLSYRVEGVKGYLQAPSQLSFGISLFAIFIIAAFAVVGRRIVIGKHVILVLLLFVAFLDLRLISIPGIIAFPVAGGFCVLIWFLGRKLDDVRMIVSLTLLLAVVSSGLVFIKGIPLVDMSLRESAAVTPFRAIFHGAAVIAGTFSIVFYRQRFFIVAISVLTALALLLGFKSDAIAVLISAGVAGLLMQKIWLRGISIITSCVVFILTIIGTYMATTTANMVDKTWELAPHLYVLYRAGFTLSVFDKIVALSFPEGYTFGQTILSPTQEVMGLEIFQYKHIITSTLIGPGMLDFGIAGVVLTCAFVGICLGILSRQKSKVQICFYAIALTHTFILIEVGLQLSSVLWYLSLLYLSNVGTKTQVS